MPSVTYKFTPNQTVYVVQGSSVKSGLVTKLLIEQELSKPLTINYFVKLTGASTSTKFAESALYETCQASSGYQDVVFTKQIAANAVAFVTTPLGPISGSPVGSPSSTIGAQASISIDGGVPVVINTALVANATFQDVISEINIALGSTGSAFIKGGNLRIQSSSTGETSTVEISDVGVGSPALTTGYFSQMKNFSGLSAPKFGDKSGAIETLGNSICIT